MKKLNANIGIAIYENSYNAIIPWIKSIGLHTYQMRYRARSLLESCAETFLANSMHTRNNQQDSYSITPYLSDSGINMIALNGNEDFSSLEQVPLPKGIELPLPLGKALFDRRSIRRFKDNAISLDYLATLLSAACGKASTIGVPMVDGTEVNFSFRTYPSAGGLYPIDIYLLAQKVDGLNQGVYKYSSNKHALFKILNDQVNKNITELSAAENEQANLEEASVVILLVMRPWKSMRKYGERGLRFAFYEVGAISQNMHLVATALDLGSVDYASFYEDEINALLGLSGVLELFSHAILIGAPA